MVGCFYASQIAPLDSQEWEEDIHKFIQAMDERRECEWLDLKELAPLRYMTFVSRVFQETTGLRLKGLTELTGWIRARSYYHWKVAELNQLKHCPHLKGVSVPQGPMECPSRLQQPLRPSKPETMAPGTSGHGGAGDKTTSGHSDDPFLMEGGAGDGLSWADKVSRAEAREGTHKRKRTETNQPAPGCPFPLVSEEARKEAMGAIYEHKVGQEPPKKNIASAALSAHHSNLTPVAVKALARHF